MNEAPHAGGDGLPALVGRLAHLLPAQGPIGVFIHHNTLHAFQHLPFEQAVCEAARLFGTEPFMTEPAYRDAAAKGRIRPEDIDAVLDGEPGADAELWPGGPASRQLWRAMLLPGVREFRPETIRWELDEGEMAGRFRQDELFRLCMASVVSAPPRSQESGGPRPGGGLREGVHELVHPLLIKLCGAFVDQGLAYWPMPNRERGFWAASVELLAQPLALQPFHLRRLAEFARKAKPWSAAEAVERFLQMFGVDGEEDRENFLKAELLALPGWAGLMHQLEADPALAPYERVPASLMDFLAVRLLITAAATSGQRPEAASIIEADSEEKALARAAAFFDALRLAGISSKQVTPLGPEGLGRLLNAVESFGGWERRRVMHLAYERRHERQILLPLGRHRRELFAGTRMDEPKRRAAQVVFCIDEREESIRRHLEETDPEMETLGAAGFFGVAINYTGIDDAHGAALCPVVVKPRHAIEERARSSEDQELLGKRRSLRRAWARSVHNWFVWSRTLVRGWAATTVLGLFTLIPLAGRVLSPRRHAQLVDWLHGRIVPEPGTGLAFEREQGGEGGGGEGLWQGFTLEEKADRVAALLGTAGLKSGMARLVVVLGHGSTSLNNPHESAHDCGACGGRRGGPNGRLFAAIANHPEVRKLLPARGIQIPEDTWFVGGYHDTCNDDVDLLDLAAVPASHAPDLRRVRSGLDRARALSAHERARRFEAADWGIDATGGLHHVQERAEHLAEPRPEYGHCTNSVCIVGRRSVTRGLFFDRRAFLVSYDASVDPEDRNLAGLLGAVIPVCGGISLEYYFSFVDNEGYGCGTKLPHNVTGLVGVMNGYESDLRTGLPLQMVEIHEPVRILFVVETSAARLEAVVRQNPLLWEFLSNRWIRLAAMDPATPEAPIVAYRDGRWEPVEGDDEPLAAVAGNTSVAWYRGRREHLPVARIGGTAA